MFYYTTFLNIKLIFVKKNKINHFINNKHTFFNNFLVSYR